VKEDAEVEGINGGGAAERETEREGERERERERQRGRERERDIERGSRGIEEGYSDLHSRRAMRLTNVVNISYFW
jgi:hypothetical protein